MALLEQFEDAKIKVQTLSVRPDNAILLKLYGLNKQATIGDFNEGPPPMFDFVATAKQNAWKSYKGLSNEDAMTDYIKLVQELLESEK
jgi:diazepam-binding inhibitor (GABA receptor modulator, acyl-CoA-binding protein)